MRTLLRSSRLGGGGCDRETEPKAPERTNTELLSVHRCSRRWLLMLITCVLGVMLATVAGCSPGDTKAQVTSRNLTTSVAQERVTSTDAPTSASAWSTTTITAASTATTAVVTTTTASTTTTTSVLSGIPWENALAYVGQEVTVVGPVVGTRYASSSNGSPTFLNVGLPYPDPGRFQVLIWGEDRGRFESPPEDLYYGQTVAVTGIVKNYKGVAEIIVKRPSQIEVY